MSSPKSRFLLRGLRRLLAVSQSGYAWVTLGMLMRSALQAGLVVALARLLGAAGYGLIVAIASVSSIFAVFAGVGVNTLHLRNLSIGGIDARDSFAFAMRRNLISLPPLCIIATLTGWVLYAHDANSLLVACLVIGDILAFAMSDVMQRTMQGHHRFRSMAFYMVLVPFARLATLGLIITAMGSMSIYAWVVVCLVTGALPMVFALAYWLRARTERGAQGAHAEHRVLEGLGFAVAAGSTRTHADADKAIVAGFSSLEAAAQYSVAYRFFDILMLPILSYIEWSMSSLFRSGSSTTGVASIRANRKFIALVTFGSIAMSLTSLACAGVLPKLLGEQYIASAHMVRYLALLPVTSSAWWIFRTLLNTTGEQGKSAVIELCGAALNIAITIALVIKLGWFGAIVATYATHIAMSVAALTFLLYRSRESADACRN